MHILKFITLLASAAGERGYFKINASLSVVALNDSLETNFKMFYTNYTVEMRYIIFNWAKDIRYDGRRLFKSKIIDILEFKKNIRATFSARKGFLCRKEV